ncbi:MAG: hypothetical protein M3Y69_00190 [Verrucomicrobiota bacterium]|nr:hypothetical protein [Verrucomicrobiota bacterium]
MRTKCTLTFLALAISAAGLQAQSPIRSVAQPTGAVATSPAPAPVTPVAGGDADATSKALLQTLLQLKASNEEILKRQTATLIQLEEVSKAAEQLKVYATRG